jgi:uncharacterized membrane protein YphA (DoxX/SURF4 family)
VAKRRTKHEPRQSATVAEGAISGEPVWLPYSLRLWLVAMFGWTLWVTRNLWSVHNVPPMLPAFEWAWLPLEKFDYFGEALFATFAACVLWPRAAWGAFVAVAAVAMLADQTRMQPQILSFALLMLGTWDDPRAKLIARTHLASLWFFSGVHKLLSPGYYETVAPWLWKGIFPVADHPQLADYARAFGTSIAVIETMMGLAVWLPRLRKCVAVMTLAMHFGIVALLNHLNGWNTSVWGWNCAIAIMGAILVAGWRDPIKVEFVKCGRAVLVASAMLFISPILFYVGRLDGYLSHCLYSDNVAKGTYYDVQRGTVYGLNYLEGPYWSRLNVPLPPAHRLFELYFRKVAKPGDRLVVHDPRWWARVTLNEDYQWDCDKNGLHRASLVPKEGTTVK